MLFRASFWEIGWFEEMRGVPEVSCGSLAILNPKALPRRVPQGGGRDTDGQHLQSGIGLSSCPARVPLGLGFPIFKVGIIRVLTPGVGRTDGLHILQKTFSSFLVHTRYCFYWSSHQCDHSGNLGPQVAVEQLATLGLPVLQWCALLWPWLWHPVSREVL